MKSSTTLVTRCQHSRRSRNTWWSHRDMVKKCTVEFSRENLEDNPHPRGPVTITTLETIAIITADRWVTWWLEYYIAKARHSMHTSTRFMSVHWVPKLLGPDQKQTQHNKGKCCHFGRSQQFLLEICEIYEIRSNTSRQQWCTNQSHGNIKVFCLLRKLRQWCLQARFWPILYRMQKECCCWTT